ncbi:MAG TPA: hypothetical protein VFH73_26380 [Polyangia bacterium]|jgi:hypothetical protein|nr:hypothetical protein [Polyangia bacterium]
MTNISRQFAWIVAVASLAPGVCGCGSSGGAPPPPDPTAGTVSGSVKGTTWDKLSNAHWIGKPATGSPPVILFLFEAPVKCSDIVNVNWDKTATGSRQILEVALKESAVRTYQIMTDAFAAYLFNDYNPDAFSGTVTIKTANPSMNIAGSFDLDFLGDKLMGTFDAKYCGDGVEP